MERASLRYKKKIKREKYAKYFYVARL